MKTGVILLIPLLLCACSTTFPPTSQTTATAILPEATPTIDMVAEMLQQANIKLSDKGKTFTFAVTSRFTVFLDDQNYPVTGLKCSPEGIIGIVTNGAYRGPDLYPVMFEGIQIGKCTLSDRDFSVQILIR